MWTAKSRPPDGDPYSVEPGVRLGGLQGIGRFLRYLWQPRVDGEAPSWGNCIAMWVARMALCGALVLAVGAGLLAWPTG